MAATRRRGRPLSYEAAAFLNAIASEPMPARGVADRLQISRTHAARIAHSLTSAGYAYQSDATASESGPPVVIYSARFET